jgi:hypothetical protein
VLDCGDYIAPRSEIILEQRTHGRVVAVNGGESSIDVRLVEHGWANSGSAGGYGGYPVASHEYSREERSDADGARGGHPLLFARRERAFESVQPTVMGRFVSRRAGFDIVLPVEVRARGIG